MKAAVDSIESFGLVDGPGIRTVVFLSGCKLRCKYCHNPEMWVKGKENYTSEELLQKIIRNKPYYKRNGGGVTFSGGEPLLQIDFLLEICPLLKQEGIHIALDTAGVGIGKYDQLLPLIDLVLLDIKHITEDGYLDITGQPITEFNKFVTEINKSNTEVWIRQVIIPDVNDNKNYVQALAKYIKQIKNVAKIEFLPYHMLGNEKYLKLGIPNPYSKKDAMDEEKCKELYTVFEQVFYGKETN